MSEQSQGPGWWQASDGKWYPPEQAPAAAPPQTQPMGAAPTEPPVGPPSGTVGEVPPPGPPAAAGAGNTGKIIAVVVALALIAGGAAFALTRGGGSSRSVKAFCDNAKKALNDDSLNNASNDPAKLDAFQAAVDQLNKTAPDEIKADMQVVDDFSKKLVSDLKAAGNDPQKTVGAVFDAANAVGSEKLQTAERNVQNFGRAKCGIDLGLTSFDSTSESSSSSSSFGSFGSLDTNGSFSFDSSSFSSLLSSFSSDFGSEFGSDFFSSFSSDFSTSS